MTTRRKELVDPSVTRWYHCIRRCVRGGYLLGEQDGLADRKQWIEDRLEFLVAKDRFVKSGKCPVKQLQNIFSEFLALASDVDVWNDRVGKMLSCRELRGTFFAADQQKIREHSSRCGTRRTNLRPQLSAAPAG